MLCQMRKQRTGDNHMTRLCHSVLRLAILFTTIGFLAFPACGQTPSAPAENPASAGIDANEAARRKIMESDRWRQTWRNFERWLSVQQLYSPAEVAAMKVEFNARIGKMSPSELESFLNE